jgi:hypothetical protein
LSVGAAVVPGPSDTDALTENVIATPSTVAVMLPFVAPASGFVVPPSDDSPESLPPSVAWSLFFSPTKPRLKCWIEADKPVVVEVVSSASYPPAALDQKTTGLEPWLDGVRVIVAGFWNTVPSGANP